MVTDRALRQERTPVALPQPAPAFGRAKPVAQSRRSEGSVARIRQDCLCSPPPRTRGRSKATGRSSATTGCLPPRTDRTRWRRCAEVVPSRARAGAVRRQGAVARPAMPNTSRVQRCGDGDDRAPEPVFRSARFGVGPTAAAAALASVPRGLCRTRISPRSDGDARQTEPRVPGRDRAGDRVRTHSSRAILAPEATTQVVRCRP